MSAKETFEEYKSKLNNHRFDQLTHLISEDCDFWHPTGTYHGIEQVRQGLEKEWEAIPDKKSEFSKAEWIVDVGNVAACVYNFYFSGTVKGQKVYEKVYATICFRREQDLWKIFHEHLSLAPA